jgi:hypothetical protein
MSQSQYRWDTCFVEIFNRCLDRYRGGDTDYTGYYSPEDLVFLSSIGCKPRELFDFVEDFGDGGEPSLTTALMIASVRRDYLRTVLDGKLSKHEINPADLPGKTEKLAGFVWLPRILMKARGKLRGELDPNTMYCCGGDRKFLREHDIAPADFLRAVWSAGEDDSKVIEFVKRHTNA